jgi:LPS export ABC transporter protein LptC
VVLQTKTSVILFLFACVLTISCSKGKGISTVNIDTENLPSIRGENINTVISDSGIVRYRMQAQVHNIYSNDTATYWHFPEGIYLEKFDSLFNVEFWLKADTAYYFETIGLWQAKENVFIQNAEGHQFETSELFWDRTADPNSLNSIYTDKFVRINLGDRIITSQGLRSNQSMTRYVFYSSAIEAIINEDE